MPQLSAQVKADGLRHAEHRLRTAFQPIFSFSHQRLVGHEALLRATGVDGETIAPQQLFERCTTIDEKRQLDRACCLVHARGFARGLDPAQWLFLNLDASAFVPTEDRTRWLAPLLGLVDDAGLRPSQIVIELLETALPDGAALEAWVDDLKRQGFIVALDDFGAGHSNFDRVFRLQPHIVKLDRGVIARAGADRSVRRVLAQMISLLHECGAQVLVEGVETAVEADIALDTDADFVQGYHFGRPSPVLRRRHETSVEMAAVWDRSGKRSQCEGESYARRVEPYGRALMEGKRLLEGNATMEAACAAFLALVDADLCYLLDTNGMQVGPRLFRMPQEAANDHDPFAPLRDVRGARWSRRPYFRRALASPGQLQLTRPYPTMHSRQMNVTLSVCCRVGGRRLVLCGDKLWNATDEHAERADRSEMEATDLGVLEPA